MNLKFDDLPEVLREMLIEQDTHYEIAIGRLIEVGKEMQGKNIDPIAFGKALATCVGAVVCMVPPAVRPLLRQMLIAEIDQSIEAGEKE